MSLLELRRGALGWCAVAALLAGCSGGASPLALPGASRTWMASDAKSGDLLYVTDLKTDAVLVYSYPQGKQVGTLGDEFGAPRSECADTKGNVWIADTEGEDVVEYAHGGTTPIVALNINGPPTGCSVDPTTGSLAVSGGVNGVVLSIFRPTKHGWGSPRRLLDTAMDTPAFCAYDAQGNLFLDGRDKAGGNAFLFYELRKGAKSFTKVKLGKTIKLPGQVQWDGTSLAVEDAGLSPSPVYRFTISGRSGKLAGTTILRKSRFVRQFWIAGSTLVGPDPAHHAVGFWNYPAGGSPAQSITNVNAYGAAVSVAQ
jgi:hypothetical protein